jgi:hypothetical protein
MVQRITCDPRQIRGIAETKRELARGDFHVAGHFVGVESSVPDSTTNDATGIFAGIDDTAT